MKKLKRKRLVAVQKYDSARQKQSQNINDFVIYLEMLKDDLNKFIIVQKKDHFFYYLRKDIKKRF